MNTMVDSISQHPNRSVDELDFGHGKPKKPIKADSDQRKRVFSIRGMVAFLTLVALVFYFYLPTSFIEFDVFAEVPPSPESKVDVFQFKSSMEPTLPIVSDAYVYEAFLYQGYPDTMEKTQLNENPKSSGGREGPEELRRCYKYRVRLRLTGFQRSQFYFRRDKYLKSYTRPSSGNF